MPVLENDVILGPLNDMQKKAVETTMGPVLILAGAGSGKTRALTHRIAYLMAKGVMPWNILAVTFTNKAANEMKERIKRILKISEQSGSDTQFLPMMGTFHSVCVRMLRRDIESIGRDRNFVIYDTDDQQKVMLDVLKDLHIVPEEMKPKAALGHIGRFKSEALTVKDVEKDAASDFTIKVAKIYSLYQARLREANAMDFDDLILETVRMLKEAPDVLDRYQETWRYLHVDEYQDTNHAQYLLISLLAQKYRNVCVIGDPDQSIYAFRGADIRNILEFQNEYKDAMTIKLEQNYRSTQPILSAADSVIEANPNRPQKKMWTERGNGSKIVLQEVEDERREAEEAVKCVQQRLKEGVPLSEQVVLYRTNAQSRTFEEACLRAGIPYRILGGVKFYARKEVKDVLAYLFTILNPNDTVSLLRVINIPSRKIGLTTISRLQGYCNERGIGLWQALKHIEMVEGINDGTKQRLSTFAALIDKYQQLATQKVVSEVSDELLRETGMEKWVKDDTDEGESRWENIQELLSVMHKYDKLPPTESLTNFLEEVALVSEVDKLQQASDALTLMTLHLCKGLEFRSVIIVGCEEGIFPHSASHFDREQLEEERRLMYVGMTRAKDHLHLFHANHRMLWGDMQSNARSRFLDDLPHELLDVRSHDVTSRFAWLSSSRKPSFGGSRLPMKEHNEFNQDNGDDDMAYDSESLVEGTRIEHHSFGQGTIVSRKGDMAEIQFDSGVKKKFALSIAPIKVIE